MGTFLGTYVNGTEFIHVQVIPHYLIHGHRRSPSHECASMFVYLHTSIQWIGYVRVNGGGGRRKKSCRVCVWWAESCYFDFLEKVLWRVYVPNMQTSRISDQITLFEPWCWLLNNFWVSHSISFIFGTTSLLFNHIRLAKFGVIWWRDENFSTDKMIRPGSS